MKTTELDPLVSPDDADVIPIADVSESATKKLSIGDLKAAIGGGGGDASTWSQHPATQDVDLDGHDVVGLPTYSGSSPPADQSVAVSFATLVNAMLEAIASWAISPASQDVDMDGNKITGLGAPTDAADAATKQYVDAQAGDSDRIKGGAGTTYEETEIGVGPDATGAFNKLLSGKNRGDEFLSLLARENSEGLGWIGWRNSRSGYGRGYVQWWSSAAELYGEHSAGTFGRVYVDGVNGGNVYFDIPGASAGGGYESSKGIRLGSHSGHTPNVRALPPGANSILHAIKVGWDGAQAVAAAKPRSETLSWSGVANVASVSHVEASIKEEGGFVDIDAAVLVTPVAAGITRASAVLSGLAPQTPRAGTASASDNATVAPASCGAVPSGGDAELTVMFDAQSTDPHMVSVRIRYEVA